MLTDRQEKFCQLIALYGFTPSDAAKEAGYVGNGKSAYCSIGKRLIDNIHISSRIAEIRESCFDVDLVRKSIILGHMQSRSFKITDYVHHELTLNDNGNPFYRLVVKPYDEWDEIAKRMCVGFDKNNIPIFKSSQDATKELCKIFGIYKENSIAKEEDTSSVLAGAGLAPSYVEPGSQNNDYEEEEFDGNSLDKELGVSSDNNDVINEMDDTDVDVFDDYYGEDE